MYWQKKWSEEDKDQSLKDEILAIRSQHKDYGYRRIHLELKNQGRVVNKKKVQRLVQIMGLQVHSYGRKYKKYNSYKGVVGKIKKNRINRRFNTCIPLQKITTDTTEFKYYEEDKTGKLQTKKLYLDPYMDMYNLEIISYVLSDQPNGVTMLQGLEVAIERTKACPYRRTFHSDRGWGYQMTAYQAMLEKHHIFQSMSRKGNCYDNAPMENFFSLLKREIYYGHNYRSRKELVQAIKQYIRYYNEDRIKEKLGGLSPKQYRERMQSA
ncbi:Integrase core domain [Urinicoccus massiliensis]|uniref:Integrase core domain n=2 Tax=Urinicoccus massiliensis TaxID=1723382 RepID=A0A8H2QXB6_9FIRM|nr:Integrase core domain [Urinicoccus massiliensis]VFB15980.1 Integrase core domain [Urinicoccus massiliensis]VFB17146.1 Integrase core domain [Urinicoccus massiliensis]